MGCFHRGSTFVGITFIRGRSTGLPDDGRVLVNSASAQLSYRMCRAGPEKLLLTASRYCYLVRDSIFSSDSFWRTHDLFLSAASATRVLRGLLSCVFLCSGGRLNSPATISGSSEGHGNPIPRARSSHADSAPTSTKHHRPRWRGARRRIPQHHDPCSGRGAFAA